MKISPSLTLSWPSQFQMRSGRALFTFVSNINKKCLRQNKMILDDFFLISGDKMLFWISDINGRQVYEPSYQKMLTLSSTPCILFFYFL